MEAKTSTVPSNFWLHWNYRPMSSRLGRSESVTSHRDRSSRSHSVNPASHSDRTPRSHSVTLSSHSDRSPRSHSLNPSSHSERGPQIESLNPSSNSVRRIPTPAAQEMGKLAQRMKYRSCPCQIDDNNVSNFAYLSVFISI